MKMGNYKFEVSVQGESATDAGEKLAAAAVLMRKLKTKEIKKMADVVANDPVTTAMAKKALKL